VARPRSGAHTAGAEFLAEAVIVSMRQTTRLSPAGLLTARRGGYGVDEETRTVRVDRIERRADGDRT